MGKTKEKGPQKTNAARLLDRAGIEYELVAYPVDEEHLEATHIAEVLGEDISSVFKTLVLRGASRELLVCVIPGDKEVDLKKAARAAGEKNVEMIHVKELLPLTGYIRGGCSPLGMKKPLRTFIHRSAQGLERFYVSAGQRGLQLLVSPSRLATLISAQFADLIAE